MQDRVELTDSMLIERCKHRDAEAFRHLVERYKKQAYGFAFSYLKNVDDAFNISQEAFIRAWNAIGTFDEQRLFRPWLFSIIKNLSLNLIARKKRLGEVSLDEAMESSGFDIGDDSSNPLEAASASETRRKVWQGIMSLKEEFREIIVLQHFEDLSYREIAETLGIPEGTVMSRLYHARLALREALADMAQRG